MPPFVPIRTGPVAPDSLYSACNKINENFDNAVNKADIAEKIEIISPTLPEIYFLNSTPSDADLARKVLLTINGLRGDSSAIEQLRLEVFHPGPGNPDATEARLYMTLNGGGLIEILRIGQDISLSGAEQAHFYFNPQPYFTDHGKTTFAILGSALGGPAKLKISDVVAGGGQYDGINFEANGAGNLSFTVGTPGPFAIPRSGGGSSGRIVLSPHVSGADYLGINTNDPLDTWAVYRVASPSMSLQSLYWDSNGPHEVYYTCKAIDGSLGRMGWIQTNYPSQPQKSKWISQSNNPSGTLTEYLEHDDDHIKYHSPTIDLEATVNYIKYTSSNFSFEADATKMKYFVPSGPIGLEVNASDVIYTDASGSESLRNEEAVSAVHYINSLSDFPTQGDDIWFPEGTIWDGNKIPFTITKDIYVNSGVILRNFNLTSYAPKLDVGTDLDTRPIIIEDSDFEFLPISPPAGNRNRGFIGGELKLVSAPFYDLNFIGCKFKTFTGGRIINIGSYSSFNETYSALKFKDCKFYYGALGSISVLDSLTLENVDLYEIRGGLFVSNVKNISISDFYIHSIEQSGVVPLMLASVENPTGSYFNMRASINNVIKSVPSNLQRSTEIFSILENNNRITAAIVSCNFFDNEEKNFLTEKIQHLYRLQYLDVGYMYEGQVLTGTDSGATAMLLAKVTKEGGTDDWYIKKLDDIPFDAFEEITSSTGTIYLNDTPTDRPGIDQTHPKVIAKGNIGIPDSSAYGHLAVFNPAPVSTSCPAGEVKRINSVYALKSSERFGGYASGNLEYLGIDPINCDVSLNIFGYIGSGPKLCTFYYAKGNLTNTIVSIVPDPTPGLLKVTTLKPNGYIQFDNVLLEGTTVYDHAYIIQSIIDAYSFRIVETYTSTVFGGFHSKLFVDVPIFKTLNGADQIAATRPIANIETNDILFLALEITGGDVFYCNAVAISATKTG